MDIQSAVMLHGYAEDHLASLLATWVGWGPQKWAFWLEESAENKQSVVIYIDRLRINMMMCWLHW